jgi:lipopolysaccharide/colanic/teichoic acid biosynthesis glycosyltransferase
MQPVGSFQDQESHPAPAHWFAEPLNPHASEPSLESSTDSPSPSKWSASSTKRLFDAAVALVALLVFAAPMLAIGILIRLSSRGPSLFVQPRAGRWGKLFPIYKFRSMVPCSDTWSGPTHTSEGDSRITPIGRILRRLKLDELPQFYNLLRGEMSLVGPRPKLPEHADIRDMPFRPGITGAATLAFRREEEMLRHIHPTLLDAFYNQQIRPTKVSIDLNYMARATFLSDMRIVAATLLVCILPEAGRHVPVAGEGQPNLELRALPHFNNDQALEELGSSSADL